MTPARKNDGVEETKVADTPNASVGTRAVATAPAEAVSFWHRWGWFAAAALLLLAVVGIMELHDYATGARQHIVIEMADDNLVDVAPLHQPLAFLRHDKFDVQGTLLKPQRFPIGEGMLAERLERFFEIAGLPKFYVKADLEGVRTSGVDGFVAASVALSALLANTGCAHEVVHNTIVLVYCKTRPVLVPVYRSAGEPLTHFVLAGSVRYWKVDGTYCHEETRVPACANPESGHIHISGGEVLDALLALSSMTSVMPSSFGEAKFIYSPEDLAGRSTQEVEGNFNISVALEHMLEGSGLKGVENKFGSVVIRPIDAVAAAPQRD